MKTNNTFSLSLQKQFTSKGIDSEINSSLNELNFKTLLGRANIVKKRGFYTHTIMYFIILLPLIRRNLSSFWSIEWIQKHSIAQKDTWYRFLNNERFNWRKLVSLLSLRIINTTDEAPLKEKVIIADDSIGPKTGKQMEMVSYHFDHKSGKSVLGNNYLQLGYHNGMNFYPIDAAMMTSKKRPNKNTRDIDKRTNGWKRRKEALRKKTEVLLEMVQRAWDNGLDASFLLFDSWFAHDDIISKVYNIGYGVICRLKRGKVKYEYKGSKYTLKQLWQQFAKKQTVYLSHFQVKAVCLNVKLPKTGDVRLVFVSDGKKQWHVFLSTDLELSAAEILSYYSRRWSIEVFFKDAKQMLYMGKEQSKTFDAAIACHSIVMIRYLLLVYILGKRRINSAIGPLFQEISDEHQLILFAEKVWSYVKEQIFKSMNVKSYAIEIDMVLQIIDIIENIISNNLNLSTAKL